MKLKRLRPAQTRLIKDDEINRLANNDEFAEASERLMQLQLNEWKQLAEGYKSLADVKTKEFLFDGFRIKLQFNPERIKSTSADVDDESIKNRECFLCEKNLPPEQKGILLLEDYLILCNPYPVFPQHFTIAAVRHRPQEILSSFNDLILISKYLSKKYTVIYNGPKCGASAPDHLHFQAGTKQFMPVENEFHSLINEHGELLVVDESLTVAIVNDGLRTFVTIEASEDKVLLNAFDVFYLIYSSMIKSSEEPMMNIICSYDKSAWKVIIFLRRKHRPSQYFEEDGIMFSPAAVDLGGVCIVPLEKDFKRIDEKLIAGMLKEVSLYKEGYDYIKAALKRKLKN